MIVLSEANQLPPSASQRDLEASTAIAQLLGFPVYFIPANFEQSETAENALLHIPPHPPSTPGIWLGYIPTPERYEAIYNAALQKGIQLLNTPEEHLRVQEFDLAYPKLQGLTPESVVIRGVEECDRALQTLGVPVFVKGTVQSYKAEGWQACVADTAEDLRRLTTQLLEPGEARSRGRVIVRKLVKLRHNRTSPSGFPMGREFRILIYQQQMLSYGYHWEGDDPYKFLSVPDETNMLALAFEAAARLQVPYVAIDVGQLEDGSWTVIETGDPQFSGTAQMPLIQLWQEIRRIG